MLIWWVLNTEHRDGCRHAVVVANDRREAAEQFAARFGRGRFTVEPIGTWEPNGSAPMWPPGAFILADG